MIQQFVQLDKDIFLWMNSFIPNYPEYNNLVYIIAEKIDSFVILLAALAMTYFVYKSIEYTSWKRFIFLVKEGVKIISAVVTSWGLSYLIKNLLALPRPFLRYPFEFNQLFEYGGFDSFPSGHATLFMALGVMMSLQHKRAGYFFIFLAILIGVARVISGVHFPIDILTGWLIGGIVSLWIYKNLNL